jgi:hypothetical protein
MLASVLLLEFLGHFLIAHQPLVTKDGQIVLGRIGILTFTGEAQVGLINAATINGDFDDMTTMTD